MHTSHFFLKHLTSQNMKQLFINYFYTSQENSLCYLWASLYREALMSLSVQGLLALNPSCFIIYFEEVLRLLVDPGALQLVDHLSSENLVRFDLKAEEWKLLKTYGKHLTSQMCVRSRSSG